MTESPKSGLPQGTLDLLILKTVALGPVHGYAIAQRLQQISRYLEDLFTRPYTGWRIASSWWQSGDKPKLAAKPSSIA